VHFFATVFVDIEEEELDEAWDLNAIEKASTNEEGNDGSE
jgi:hypothetical protein